MATGRPIEVADKRPRFKFRAMEICPNLLGGKNWQPMSYNPQTGLVYIPSINLCMDMEGAEPAYKRGKFYLGVRVRPRQGRPRRLHERADRVGPGEAAEGVGQQGRRCPGSAAR